ncbi:hypothetical protein [Accumulibacter sp.]|uniref:hypothetical protein n=1 Tax=Accumulibacter sp. TaxID=2053492 RepID=UPI0025FBE0C0|nr:hypothetical protein [Accumulibacter sp.]MCM8595247.1 hypothetical protein [Accumulibacter sp.]MCM8626445.1 hypothetical protein [Accumulibacter sp.]MDS4049393.1 hypothetical protein [Accumulibacter sp.]
MAIFLGPLLLAYGVLVWRRKAAASRADGPGLFQPLQQAVDQGLPRWSWLLKRFAEEGDATAGHCFLWRRRCPVRW